MVTLALIIPMPCTGTQPLSDHLARQVLTLAETIPQPIRGEFFAWLGRHTQGTACLPGELAPWLAGLPDERVRLDEYGVIVLEILWFRKHALEILTGKVRV
jgi:hypothetical protein